VKGGVEQVEKRRITHTYRAGFDEVADCRSRRIVGKLPDAEMENEDLVSFPQEIEYEIEPVWNGMSQPVCGGDYEDLHRFRGEFGGRWG